jgi:hypothetical protein
MGAASDVPPAGRARQGLRTVITLPIVTALLVCGAVAFAVLRHGACSDATGPLGTFASGGSLPRLCALGAPSKLIGQGRTDALSWRAVVTPPEPPEVYEAAGFGTASPGGAEGCIVVVYGDGHSDVSCGGWDPPTPYAAGQFVWASCGTGPSVCDAAAQGRVAHFAVLTADGSKITLASVSFHGHSFAVGGLPAGHQPVAILAYSSAGQQIGSIKV